MVSKELTTTLLCGSLFCMYTKIFLDIDGTINAHSDKPPRINTQWRGDWGRVKQGKYWILWSQELVAALTDLSELEDVEVIWLTDWSHKAPAAGEMFGLPEFDYIPEFESEDGWWKLRYVQETWETRDSRIVWLDDLIGGSSETSNWSMGRKDLLTISPNQYHGLSRKHIESVRDFLKVDE